MANSKRMDNKKIEKAAVNRIRDLIQPCDTIDDKLDEDDKNILTDGVLDLYSSSEQKVGNFRAEIPVQVKGTTKSLVSNKHGVVKFYLSTEVLKGYRDAFHGMLLFVVHVNTKTRLGEGVFYAQLLPYDIDKILSGTRQDQVKVPVRVKPFPTDPKEITRIITAYNANREEQMKAKIVAYDFKGDIQHLPAGIASVEFSTQLLPGESMTTLAGLENSYVYGKTIGGQLVVLGKIEDVTMVAQGSEATVGSGNFMMKTQLLVGDHLEGKYLEFEGVSMILRKNREISLHFDVKGPFHRRFYTTKFIYEFLRTGELIVNGETWLRIETESEPALENRLEKDAELYRKFVEMLDSLGIVNDWDPADMTVKELNDLLLVHYLLVEGKPWTGREIESPVVYFDIQGCRVFALVRKREDGSYAFTGLDSDEMCFSFIASDAEKSGTSGLSDPVPAVMALNEGDLQKAVNLNPEKLASQFDRFPVTAGNQTPLNQKLLEMLVAYDQGSKQPQALLACATTLAKRLYEFDKSNRVYLLNLMQTIKRKRELDDTEKSLLREVVLDAPERYAKAAAYALLDEQEMAEMCLERCTEAERKQIENYPIVHFFRADSLPSN